MLRTKLQRPNLGPDLVVRDHLIQQLDQNSHKPLALISAPSGYGKSILLSQWIEANKANAAWLSLDSEHQDLRVFLEYFVTALQTVVDKDFQKVMEFINGQQLPPVEMIFEALIDELDKVEDNFVLVLDDYQVINNNGIHELINMFIAYPVEKLQLAIVCRRDPPLKINQLRLYNRINEIRLADLAFSLEDTKALASKKIAHDLSEEEISKIYKRAEGWVLGLQMILMTDEIQKVNAGIQPSAHYSLTDYSEFFADLILKRFSDEFRETLYISSILERFNNELINALLEGTNMHSKISGSSFIEDLVANNLFIYKLDDEGIWYRYHHFFREMLLKQLQKDHSKEEISSLHKKASHWFEKNEYLEEAFHHALESGDVDLAVSIFSKNRTSLFNTDQIRRIRKWFDKLPEGTVEKHLDLLLTRAVLQEEVYDFTSMEHDLKIAERLIENIDQNSPACNQLLGEFHTAYALFTYSTGKYEEAHLHSKKAVALIPDTTQLIGLYAFSLTNFTLNALGNFKNAITPQLENLKKIPRSEEIPRLYGNIGIAILYSFQGNLHEIYKSALECLNLGKKYKLWVSMGYGSYYCGEINYQWNNLEEAVKYSETLGVHAYQGRAYWALPTLYTKAFSFQALGKKMELSETLVEIEAFTEATMLEIYHELTKAFKVDLAIRQGEIDKAVELSKTTDFDTVYLDYTFYFQQLTYIRLLIITDYHVNLSEIEQLIEKYIEIGRSGYKYNLLMQVLLLQSIHLKYKGENESAVESLKEAIELAEPAGFIRIFVDLGEPMKELLEEFQRTEPKSSYVSDILDAFEKELPLNLPEREISSKDSAGEITKLSRREIETLKFIAQGFRNKEIADSLFISVETVKSHVKNCLRKLEAKNRVELVQKARIYEIIDSEN